MVNICLQSTFLFWQKICSFIFRDLKFRYSNGSFFLGTFNHGMREGPGSLQVFMTSNKMVDVAKASTIKATITKVKKAQKPR